MKPPKTLRRAWLLLGLTVLLAHLALLQALPLGLDPQAPDAPLSFDTRTLALPPQAALTPTAPTLAKPVKSRPTATPARPAVRSLAKPQQQTPEATAPTALAPAQASAPVLPASAPTEPHPSQPTPALAAAAPPAHAESAADATPKRPPRQPAPYFNAESLADSTRLIYQVDASKFPFRLSAELSWHKLADSYDARLSYSAFGQNRTQTSKGHITDAGLAPERFSDKFRSEQAAHFDRARGLVTFSANTPDAPLLSGAQDRLSVLIQLGALVASEPERYGPGSTLTIQTFGPRAGDLWLFTVEQTETLELPGGRQQALKLVRMPREPYDQKVEIWLAPALGHLPARVRITETNGDAIDQKWLSTDHPDQPT